VLDFVYERVDILEELDLVLKLLDVDWKEWGFRVDLAL
jgi:hypothetical protein